MVKKNERGIRINRTWTWRINCVFKKSWYTYNATKTSNFEIHDFFKTHPSADEIYQALSPDFPNISVATIYNNLRVFKDIGIVKELTYGDASSRFDFNTHNHYHIICEKCGKIVDFHYPQLDEVEQLAQHVTEFDVTHHRMEIYGICKECKDKEE